MRATIRERGTARMVLIPFIFIGWAATAVATAAVITVAMATLVPLLVLVAGFEAIFALHLNVERIGRYLQVFHERDDGWERVAMRFGQRFPGSGTDPLFAAHVPARDVGQFPAGGARRGRPGTGRSSRFCTWFSSIGCEWPARSRPPSAPGTSSDSRRCIASTPSRRGTGSPDQRLIFRGATPGIEIFARPAATIGHRNTDLWSETLRVRATCAASHARVAIIARQGHRQQQRPRGPLPGIRCIERLGRRVRACRRAAAVDGDRRNPQADRDVGVGRALVERQPPAPAPASLTRAVATIGASGGMPPARTIPHQLLLHRQTAAVRPALVFLGQCQRRATSESRRRAPPSAAGSAERRSTSIHASAAIALTDVPPPTRPTLNVVCGSRGTCRSAMPASPGRARGPDWRSRNRRSCGRRVP